jgi:hypothetical protein
MSRIKHAIGRPFLAAWITRVGKLIINFGVSEFETYLWLVQLSEVPEKIPEFSILRFAQRVENIMEFVKSRGYSENWKVETQKCWDEAFDQAKFGNRIAHSPLTFGWNKEPEEGEPDFIGIVDLQRRDSSQNAPASKAEMDGAINSIASLATKLVNLKTDRCSIRDSRHE